MDTNNELNEPFISYGAADDSNVYNLVNAVRRGIEYLFFVKLVKNSPFTMEEWSVFMHLSPRTLQRHKKENKAFDSASSEKILELTMLYKFGNEVFGSKENFGNWLTATNIALGGIQPKELLDSSFGMQLIKDELTRIEHGVFA